MRDTREAAPPGGPWENGTIESFNGKLRDAVLHREVFETVWEAKMLVERRQREYNQTRPHSALGYRPAALEAMGPTDLDMPLVVGSAAPPDNGQRTHSSSGPSIRGRSL